MAKGQINGYSLPDENGKLGQRVEVRAFQTIFTRAGEGTGRTVEGYAAIFNSKTRIGGESWGYDEIIEAGAFDDAISSSDCRALFNHKADHLLARQSSGTLKLTLDGKGLKYEFESPNTQCGNDILEMMSRGDLKESSFAFTVKEEEWKEEKLADGKWKYTRTIRKVDKLYDVSPVTYPAYADTTVAKRSLDTWLETHGRASHEEPKEPTAKGHDPALIRAIYG